MGINGSKGIDVLYNESFGEVSSNAESHVGIFLVCSAIVTNIIPYRGHYGTTIAIKYRNIGRFYSRGRIVRLDELGQTFVVRLVLRL